MRTLRRKLLRDLWRLRYQGLTIALLVGCGIASFVAAVSAAASVQASRDAFYEEAHFADIFARLKRAPRPLLDRLREVPGVAAVEGRVVGDFRLVVEGGTDPVAVHFVSVGWPEEARLDQTRMKAGRQVEPGSSDEIVLSAIFAEACGILPGATVTAVVHGRLAKLRVVGIAVSPEFVSVADPRTGLPDPWHVDVARAVRAPLDQKVVDDGRARVRERYTVSAPVAGALARIDLNEGDVVEPGTVLARLLPLPSPLLDPRSRKVAEQRLASSIDAQRQAEATITRAETADDQSRGELARTDALAKEGTLPPAQLDQAAADSRMRHAELASARFSEKVAAHDAEQARTALERFSPGARLSEQFEVTSPVHGEVLHVLHKSGGVVEAGTALIEVGDPQALELVVDVLSQDAVAVRPGMPARLLHWGSEPPLTAQVRRVEPSAFTKTSALGVDEQRVNVVLDPEGPPEAWRPLGDGFAAEIEITVWSKPDVMQVPTSALFRRGSGWAAFTVRDGRAIARGVEIGHRGALQTEVVAGLEPDEVVIIHPGASVHEGVKVVSR